MAARSSISPATARTLRLHRCRSPLFLLPAAVAAGMPLQLRWREILCAADADADAILWVGDGEALLDSAATEVEIRPDIAAPAARPFLDPAELARPLRDFPRPGASRSTTPSGAGSMPWPPVSRCRPAPNPASRGRAAATRTPELRGYSGRPRWRRAAVSVFCSRQAMVIGPTPPGTGVMAPATLTASS